MMLLPFGRTGWQVSALTFGAWQLGGTWGAVSEADGTAALLAAFDHGINFVDTAAAYGKGRSEEIVGKAMRMRANQDVRVATKVLPLGGTQGQVDFDTIRGQYPAQYLRDAVEASLKRLGRDCIDLLQLHLWIEDGVHELEWLAPLQRMVEEGKIRWLGVSLPDARPQTGVALAHTDLVSSIQVQFNLFEQSPKQQLLPASQESQTAIIARVPFDSGALTGTWNASTRAEWSPDDKRRQMYTPERMAETLARVEALRNQTARQYPDLTTAALQFCLSEQAVATVTCGMRSVAEVESNIAAVGAEPMSEDLVKSLAAHKWSHVFY